jgi:hypothetical protein
METVESSVDTKVEQLRDWLSKETGLTVHGKLQLDLRCHRLYFEKNDDTEWFYVLDVYMGDVNEQDVTTLAANLTAAKWQQVLQTYSGKLVPFFMDKRFTDPTKFHVWPRSVR